MPKISIIANVRLVLLSQGTAKRNCAEALATHRNNRFQAIGSVFSWDNIFYFFCLASGDIDLSSNFSELMYLLF